MAKKRDKKEPKEKNSREAKSRPEKRDEFMDIIHYDRLTEPASICWKIYD